MTTAAIHLSARSAWLGAALALGLAAPALSQGTVPGSVQPAPNQTVPGQTMPGSVAPQAPAATPNAPVAAPGQDMFFRDTAGQATWRTSVVIGEGVYNRAGERIGEVDELIVDGSGRIAAAVIGVGGFLGLGERKVAMSFSAFEMTREASGNPRLVVDIGKEALRGAPEYRPANRG